MLAPNDTQFTASDPAHSVWLAAHAGTGKTKVLVDRVLRLLMQGVNPGAISCITYTKAAAIEMQLRIRKRLSEWVHLPDGELVETLHALLGRDATQSEMQLARNLLCVLIDDAQGVKAQTIHSFCQALLARFPVESGVPPHFQLLDERTARELLQEAKQRLFSYALEHDEGVKQALRHIASQTSDMGIDEIINALLKDYKRLGVLMRERSGFIRMTTLMYAGLGVEYGMRGSDIISATMQWSDTPMNVFVQDLLKFGKTEEKFGLAIAMWRDSSREESDFAALELALLTKDKYEPRKLGKKAQAEEAVLTAFTLFQAMVCDAGNLLRSLQTAELTKSVYIVAEALLVLYQRLKKEQAYLDYDDLIWHATALLSMEGMSAWVMSQLDYQIEHLLLDEAQDTSPMQWRLTQRLTSELFTPENGSNIPRSIFVVGDEKQSIYSFQGADVEMFHYWRDYYDEWYRQTAQSFKTLTLDTSYRSSAAVLSLVDNLFAMPHAADGVISEEFSHKVHRGGQAGRVALWPLLHADDADAPLPWQIDEPDYNAQNVQQQLAAQIAQEVAGWINGKRVLPSKGRAVQAGDVMVLLRRRTELVPLLAKQLKQLGVEVAGADRLALTSHLAVEDVLALAEACLHPFDDLLVASVLKGPWFGVSEDALYELAHGRGDVPLIERLDATLKAQWDTIAQAARSMDVHGWLVYVLEQCAGRAKSKARFGAEIDDLFDELLQQSLLYESNHIATLQGFIHWLRVSDLEIKREMATAGNKVRIMTIHGAKGLQAPIVILPDTTSVPDSRKTTLWWDEVSEGVLEQSVSYVQPVGVKTPEALSHVKNRATQATLREYRRLLYVALTRAEDELYITGIMPKRKKTLPSECWYALIEQTLRAMPDVVEDGDVLSIECEQTEEVKKAKAKVDVDYASLPQWVTLPVAAEKQTAHITPSAAKGGFLSAGDMGNIHASSHARERGNLTHLLLQWLPSYGSTLARESLYALADRLQPDMLNLPLDEIVDEVLAIWNDDALARLLFSAQAHAELSLCGMLGADHSTLGQIDCLVVGGNHIDIIDYKTNANPPTNVADISPDYIYQLSVYHALVRCLYPHHTIRCALLWTRSAELMTVDGSMLVDVVPAPLDSKAG